MKEKIIAAPAHHAFRADLLDLLDKHAGRLDATDMLALAAHVVGQLIALQDQRKVSPQTAMECVSLNIELGNREAMSGLDAAKGRA